MMGLYRFHWNYGRMGNVDGLFIEDMDTIQCSYGKRVSFGEILGKHSEVEGELQQEDFELLSTEEDKIDWLCAVSGGNTISGYNPFEYLQGED